MDGGACDHDWVAPTIYMHEFVGRPDLIDFALLGQICSKCPARRRYLGPAFGFEYSPPSANPGLRNTAAKEPEHETKKVVGESIMRKLWHELFGGW